MYTVAAPTPMPLPPTVEHLPALHSVDRGATPLPVAIIAHGTGGSDSRAALQTGDGRGVSTHTLHPKSGLIYRMVPDERGANHAGAPTSSFTYNGKTYRGGAVNRATLGLEIENLQDGRDPYTEAQLLSAGWQILQWRKKYGPLPIIRHASLDPTRRRDTHNLTVNDLERYVAKAMAAEKPAAATYRAIACAPVFQDRRPDAILAGVVAVGAVELMDDLTAGWLHLKSGWGFSPVSCWEVA